MPAQFTYTKPTTSKTPLGPGRMTPFSVIIPLIKSGGVTSNAGFQQDIAFGAREVSISSAEGLSSISISEPERKDTSNVVKGDAT